MSEFNFLPKAIEMVKQAVAEDNAEHYDKAKFLYTQSLEYVRLSFVLDGTSSGRRYLIPLSHVSP
jgi:hypothetical protein